MKRVTGIGGVFFNANDPVALRAWYERHLGIDVQDWGGTAFTSLDAAGNPTGATIVWSIGAADNTQFAPSKATFMINYRVEDLDAVLRALQNEGCNVLEKTDNSGHGKFAWVMDPEGNKIELWQESSGKPRVPDADFFRALEVERTQALVARDVTTIRRLHAPDYELISVPGRVMSLERYLSLMAIDVFYAKWEHGPMRVQLSEGMAAVRYQAKITFPSGKVVDCWHTDMYALQSGAWKAVWSQATQLAPDSAS